MPPATANGSWRPATAAFAERGADLPLEKIAQRAGSGLATLEQGAPGDGPDHMDLDSLAS
jgi:hypothetical protein